jgi:hypothetical protein
MATGFSSANVATPWLNTLRGTNMTAFSTTYVKLHVGDPGASAAANAAAGSTTRVVVSFAAPSGNAIAMTGTAPSWTNGGSSETLTHLSLWDASSSGNFILSGALTISQAWVSTNTFTLTSLSVSLSPIAA